MKTYRTSEVAEILGVHPNTVMLYEKWGYIPPVERKNNGYRIYTETHLEQMKLIRIALKSELIKSYMRFEIKNVIRSSAKGDLRKALGLSMVYLSHIQNEKNNEFKVIKVIQNIIKNDLPEDEMNSVNRNGAAKRIGVSINVIINWERNGLIDVPRNKNGYRVYWKDEIKQLKIIKVLRQENYSTHCICKMLINLKNRLESNTLFSSDDTEAAGNFLLSSLGEAESYAKELVDYISELLSE